MAGLVKLHTLKMESNKLFQIGHSTFKDLLNMKLMNFSDNSLLLANQSLFLGCKKLEYLGFSKNNISQFFSQWIISNFLKTADNVSLCSLCLILILKEIFLDINDKTISLNIKRGCINL